MLPNCLSAEGKRDSSVRSSLLGILLRGEGGETRIWDKRGFGSKWLREVRESGRGSLRAGENGTKCSRDSQA